MAASSSSQPDYVPVPSTSNPHPKIGKKTTSRKGKGKENLPQARQRELEPISSDRDRDVDGLEGSSWEWTPLTDSSASKVPPVFTKDGSYFFSLVGSSVKIHSVSTGQIVSTLCAPRCTDDPTSSSLLTAAIINPHNAFQLITGSLDGRLMVWDFLDAALLKIIDVAQPIHYVCAHETFRDSVFVAVSRPSKKVRSSGTDDNAVVLRVSLKSTDNSTRPMEISPVGKTRFPTGLTFSPSGTWLIATAGHTAYVAVSSSLTSGFTKYVSPERLTCLAFHPTEEYFATGDEKGNIRLWYCLTEALPINVRGLEKKTQTTTLHWHAHAVSSIAFTSNGAYLLSGGEESVLVIWQLHTGKKEFVPRVGAPINTVSLSKVGGSEEEYLLGLADATYLFISAGNLKISRTYSRIKLDPAIPHDWPSSSQDTPIPLAIHSLTSTLILPSSHPSSIQIYSPSSSKLISELEISPSNRVSRRDEKPIVPSRVERTVTSTSGEWLASIDSRESEDGFKSEVYLKIWDWDHKAGHWLLNTRIDRPHGLKKVTCMAFSPYSKNHQSTYLVTTGEDGHVKTWGIKTVKNKAGVTEEFWVTRSTFDFRSEIPQSVSWSPDASLLAISSGPYVTIYDPTTNALCKTLMSPELKLTTSACFVGKSGRYLAVSGKNDIILWDLVTQCARWHYKSSSTIDIVVAHPEDETFAAFQNYTPSLKHRKTKISIFHIGSAIPQRESSVPFRLRAMSLYYILSEPSTYTFIGITSDWRVVLFGDSVKLAKEAGSTAKELTAGATSVRRSLFQDIFGKSAFTTSPDVALPEAGPIRHQKVNDGTNTFDHPAYLMPPLEHLFEPLMSNFLKARLFHDPPPLNTTGDDDRDVDMDEAAPDLSSVAPKHERLVNQEEIDVFVSLFKAHSVGVRPPPSNGNGHLGTMSSLHSPSATPAVNALKQVTTPRSKPTLAPSPSLRSINGKKRKSSSS